MMSHHRHCPARNGEQCRCVARGPLKEGGVYETRYRALAVPSKTEWRLGRIRRLFNRSAIVDFELRPNHEPNEWHVLLGDINP